MPSDIINFLEAWKDCGYDAYEMSRRLGYDIDWNRIRANYLRHSQTDDRGNGGYRHTGWRDRATSSRGTWGSGQG
eukprot:1051029-Pyramimonas_sp.AAC.1